MAGPLTRVWGHAGRVLPYMAGSGRVCGGMQDARSLIWQVLDAFAEACMRQDARSLIWQVVDACVGACRTRAA